MSAPEFYQLAEYYSSRARAEGVQYSQDILAVGVNERLYQKQAFISSLLLAPFYLLFGEFGFPLFQVLVTVLLLLAIRNVANQIARVETGHIVLPLATLNSQLLHPIYAYSLSYDQHGTALFLIGLACSRRYPFLGALVATLPISVRPTNILLLPLLLLYARGIDLHMLFKLRLGVALGVLAWCYANVIFWGEPITISYHHIFRFDEQGYLIEEPLALFFGLSELTSNLYPALLSQQSGILFHNFR